MDIQLGAEVLEDELVDGHTALAGGGGEEQLGDDDLHDGPHQGVGLRRDPAWIAAPQYRGAPSSFDLPSLVPATRVSLLSASLSRPLFDSRAYAWVNGYRDFGGSAGLVAGISVALGPRSTAGANLNMGRGQSYGGLQASHAAVANGDFGGQLQLLHGDLERELAPMLLSEGLGLMVWSPLAGGLLSGKYDLSAEGAKGEGRRAAFDFPPVDLKRAMPLVATMSAMADKRGVSVAQIALAWLLYQPVVSTVIVGAKRPDQLADNIAATDVELEAAELEKLDQLRLSSCE